MAEFEKSIPDRPTDEQGAITFERDAEGVTVRVVGELDLSLAPELNRALEQHAVAEHSRLLLDLDGVDFMDSTGLAAVLRAQHSAEANGHHLTVRAGSPQVKRLFELTGMNDQFTLEGHATVAKFDAPAADRAG